MEHIILYTDGGARGNPGPAGAGVVIVGAGGQVLKTARKALGTMTNNEAEYHAVLLGLAELKKLIGKIKIRSTPVELRVDSELIARQLTGRYKITEEHLQPLFMRVWNERVEHFKKFSVSEIPREENAAADRLANEAMDEAEQRGLF